MNVRQASPALTELLPSTSEAFSNSEDVVIVATFTSDKSESFKAFESVAIKLRDKFLFGYQIGAADKIVLHKKFDDGKVDFSGPITTETITSFVESESVALVGEVGPDNYSQYVERGLPIGYFFYENAAQKDDYKTAVTAVATSFKGKASIVFIDAAKFAGHGNSMNLLIFPGFVIANTKASTKFPYSGELTAEGITAHVAGVLDGSIVPSLKSAVEPVPNDEPVLIVVNKSFNDVVNNKAKDVFIELYAPW